MAWDLSEGRPLWGIRHTKKGFLLQAAKPLRTVYFTQEDTEDDLHDRFDLMRRAGREPNDRVWVVPKNLKMLLDSIAGMDVIKKEIDEVVATAGPVDLILFDPMRRMHAKSENDSEVIAALWGKLDEIHVKYNCSTIFSHHIIKPPKDTMSNFDLSSPFAARGSGDIFGGGDAFINVVPEPMRGQPSKYRDLGLHFESKRARPLPPVKLRLSFETGQASFLGFLQGRTQGDHESEPILGAQDI